MAQPIQHIAPTLLPGSGDFLTLAAVAVAAPAPAYTKQLEVPDGVGSVFFELKYTPASNTGAPKVAIEVTTRGTNAMRLLVIDPTLTTLSGPPAVAQQMAYVQELLLPAPGSSPTPYYFPIPYKVDRGIVGVRLLVAEYGDTGNPGEVEVYATLAYGS